MGKSTKKTVSKKDDAAKVEARPVGQGKDPLAEGNTLVNPSNSEAETHYDVKEKSADVSTIAGQDANERAEEHNAQAVSAAANNENVHPNADSAEQDDVAEGREEPSSEEAPEEVPESSDAEEAPEAPADDSEKPDGTDTETDPLAGEANDKSV